jgi:RND family efflux transporter MFP subunit
VQSYALILRTIGSATARRSSDVIAAESGEVVEVAMEANSLVAEGDVLLRLDDRAQTLALEIARAERDLALATVNRYETLENAGNLSVTEVTVLEAANDLRLAEANVGIAELNLENRTIVASISGQVGLSNIHVGDRVSVGDPIVTIDDTTTLLAEFEVAERSIALLSEGKEALVGTPTYAGRVFRGPIVAFDSRLDSLTRSATVQAEIDNSEGLLLSGMTFAVRIIDNTDPLPVVPSTAITWTRDGSGIWISEDGKVSRHPVTIRYRDGDRVWVETDVAPDSLVVVEGASKLRDGASVVDANAAPVGGEQS